MLNSKMLEGQRRAIEAAQANKNADAAAKLYEWHEGEVKKALRPWKQGFWTALIGAALGMGLIAYVSIDAMRQERAKVKVVPWNSVAEKSPMPFTPLVVEKREGGWEAGFLNEEGEFMRYCDGTRIRGAMYYIVIHERK